MSEPMQVAVTGASGMVGRVLVDGLDRDRFAVRSLGRQDADITDLAALEDAVAGADAIVHLAANAQVDAAWEDLVGPNLVGAHHAYEAARRAGVRRVVFASSNHVVGTYLFDDDRFADPERPTLVAVDDPVRPDSFYGASKAWGEALGRYYAEWHGLQVVCLRIGWVTADDRAPQPAGVIDDPDARRRAPAMWLSHRDCVSLVEAALTANVDRFAIVHGVSDNRGRWFSLEEGRRVLGWQPRDGLR